MVKKIDSIYVRQRKICAVLDSCAITKYGFIRRVQSEFCCFSGELGI
jgi:hypothetical protein